MRYAPTFRREPNDTCYFCGDVPGGQMLEMPCGKEIFVSDADFVSDIPFYCPFTGIEVFIPKGAEW